MEEINRNGFEPQINHPRTSLIGFRNNEMGERLSKKPEVIGIFYHSSFNPLHATDAGSDLDLTIIIDGKKALSPGRTHIPWHNFKYYIAMEDGKPLEVDLYYFDITDDRPWDIRTKEGYSHSATLVFDRDGRCQEWLNRHVEMTPEDRVKSIQTLSCKIKHNLDEMEEFEELDKRLALANIVNWLEEIVYWINWEYPVDPKWRFSMIRSNLSWKPTPLFERFAKAAQTTNLNTAEKAVRSIFGDISKKVKSEGIDFDASQDTSSNSSKSVSRRLTLERLVTRLDNYSDHTPKKCVKRLLPWNGHDIIWLGVTNAVDLIYTLNNVTPPNSKKFAGLWDLPWLPKNAKSLLYRASSVRDYESGTAVNERSEALRELFNELANKVAEEGLFKMGSLYSEDFINQPLFGEDAIFTHMFGKEGGYINRQQDNPTYAVELLKRVKPLDLSNFDENMLWGMCNQYLISTDEELVALLNESNIPPEYLTVLDKIIPILN